MNEGILLLLVILATIGSGIVVFNYRDLVWPERFPRRPAGPARLRRPPAAPPRTTRQAETKPKPAATVSSSVSPIAMPNNDSEMIAFRALAKLITAGVITETVALENAFDVRAGSSKRYKEVQAKLKAALAELEKESEQTPA